MDIAAIKGETREPGGRHVNERLRRRGLVPAVIYGHGNAPETVALSRHDLELALEHLTHVIKLKVGGKVTQYLVKEVQYDHLQHKPIHVDLMRVDVKERVRVKVPIELRGTARGCAEGGDLVQVISDLDVECPLLEIPESLRVRVDHLALNEALHVSEVTLPEHVTALHKPEDIVAVVHPPRGMTSAEIDALEGEESESTEEPEIIGKGSKEESKGDADGA